MDLNLRAYEGLDEESDFDNDDKDDSTEGEPTDEPYDFDDETEDEKDIS